MWPWIHRWLQRLDRRRQEVLFESRVVVTVDDDGIRAVYPDGGIQSIKWNDVVRLSIVTNDSGPSGADVWWVLESDRDGCTYPGGATGEGEALRIYGERFQGFDNGAVVRAMGSTSNARFVCWQKARME